MKVVFNEEKFNLIENGNQGGAGETIRFLIDAEGVVFEDLEDAARNAGDTIYVEDDQGVKTDAYVGYDVFDGIRKEYDQPVGEEQTADIFIVTFKKEDEQTQLDSIEQTVSEIYANQLMGV